MCVSRFTPLVHRLCFVYQVCTCSYACRLFLDQGPKGEFVINFALWSWRLSTEITETLVKPVWQALLLYSRTCLRYYIYACFFFNWYNVSEVIYRISAFNRINGWIHYWINPETTTVRILRGFSWHCWTCHWNVDFPYCWWNHLQQKDSACKLEMNDWPQI